jgi:hypothetical protein
LAQSFDKAESLLCENAAWAKEAVFWERDGREKHALQRNEPDSKRVKTALDCTDREWVATGWPRFFNPVRLERNA